MHRCHILAAGGLAALLLALPPAAWPRDIPITLVHTTDLHGHWGTPAHTGPHPKPQAGLLQAATIIRRLRADCPHLILIDCGDTFQGTPESWSDRGDGTVRAMQILRYDLWVPGNHDFDWGVEAFERFARHFPGTLLAANLSHPGRAGPPLPTWKPWQIIHVGGARVGFIGLTHPTIPRWHLPDQTAGYAVEGNTEAATRALRALRSAGADVVVLATHQGPALAGDPGDSLNQIMRWVPDVDVVLGGHTHTNIPGVLRDDVLFTQAGAHGQYVGRVDLVFDDRTRRVVRKTSRLIEVTPETPADAELSLLLRERWTRARKDLERVAGEIRPAPEPLRPEALIQAAMMEASGAIAAFQGPLSRADLSAGLVLESDLWRLVPYDNRIGVLWLTPPEIQRVAEEACALNDPRHLPGLGGLRCEYRPRADAGSRVSWPLTAAGDRLAEDVRVPVAFNSHDLASGGGRYPKLADLARRPETRLGWAKMETREALRSYLQRHRPLDPGQLPAPGLMEIRTSRRKAKPRASSRKPGEARGLVVEVRGGPATAGTRPVSQRQIDAGIAPLDVPVGVGDVGPVGHAVVPDVV